MMTFSRLQENISSFPQSLRRQVRQRFKIVESLVRWQAGWPGQTVPGIKRIPADEAVLYPVIAVSGMSELVPPLLDVLQHHQLRATFAIYADEAIQNAPLLRKILDAGHGMADRSFSPPHSQNDTQRQSLRAMRNSRQVIQQLANDEPQYWLPDVDASILQRRWAEHLEMTVIEPAHWLKMRPNKGLLRAYCRISEKLTSGMILGLSPTQNLDETSSQFDSLLTRLQFTGWQVRPLPARSILDDSAQPTKDRFHSWPRSA